MDDSTETSSLYDADTDWRVEAASTSSMVPMPPSRRALAEALRSDVPLPWGSAVRDLIVKWAAGEANEEVDALVISLGVSVIQYSNWLGAERWRADRAADACDHAEALVEDLEARLDAVRKALWEVVPRP